LLALFSLAVRAGGTSLSLMVTAAPGLGNAGAILTFAALYVVVIAETGRIPVDNPDTHLELTMVHEGMILEAAGPDLALYHLGAMVKQLLLLSLLADLFLPWGLAAPGDSASLLAFSAALYALKLVVLATSLAVTETAMAKLRIFRVPDLMGTAFALALLGLAAGPALHA
jgi:formate hydrogenlyase subunit 4